MPIPVAIFRRRLLTIGRVLGVWNASCRDSVVHRAADALLRGWGVVTREYPLLDAGLVLVSGLKDESASAMR